jgi:hypothetical protein
MGIEAKGIEYPSDKIIVENFQNLGKEMVIQVQKSFRRLTRQIEKNVSMSSYN